MFRAPSDVARLVLRTRLEVFNTMSTKAPGLALLLTIVFTGGLAAAPNGPLPAGYNVGEYILSQDLLPGSRDVNGNHVPVPPISTVSSSNIDFASRAAFGSPGGFALALNTARQQAYAGFQRTFTVLSIANPGQADVVGWIDLPNTVTAVAYPGTGNYVFAALNANGLAAIDISNPSTPLLASTLGGLGATAGVQVIGNTAYVTGSSGLFTVNVTNPLLMTISDTLATGTSSSGVFVSGTRAYVGTGNTGMRIVDVTDPLNIILLGTFDTPGSARGVEVSGTVAYVADGVPNSLQVVDVTNPAAPAFLGSLAFGDDVRDVEISGTLAYLAAETIGLRIVDVSIPATPTLVGFVDTAGSSNAIVLAANRAYVLDSSITNGDGGLNICDVTTPASPVLLSNLDTPGTLLDVSWDGRYAFVAGGGGAAGSFDVIDTNLLQRPRTVAHVFPSPNIAINGLHRAGNLLALCRATTGLTLFDVTNPVTPIQRGTYNSPGTAQDVFISGNFAYLADNATLEIVNVTNPTTPTLAASLSLAGTPKGIYVSGSYAFVASGTGGTHVVDVTVPTAPVLKATFASTSAEGVFVGNNKAYVADGTAGLLLLDVTNPIAPGWMSTTALSPSGDARDVTAVGHLVYVAAMAGGMQVFDASNPYAPASVGFFDTDDNVTGLDAEGGYVLAADENFGAYILHQTSQCIDAYEPNESFTQPAAIASGSLYDAKICSATDLDYYALTLASGGTISVAMHPPAGKDYDLFLYDPGKVLIDSSVQNGDATEDVGAVVATGGTYFVLVRGHNASQFSSTELYALVPDVDLCPTIPLAVYLFPAPTTDLNGNIVLHIQDPNQGGVVTGYNIYRDTDAIPPFPLRALNIKDMDSGTPNIQFTDVGSNVGGPYFYLVKPYNATCGSEGP